MPRGLAEDKDSQNPWVVDIGGPCPADSEQSRQGSLTRADVARVYYPVPTRVAAPAAAPSSAPVAPSVAVAIPQAPAVPAARSPQPMEEIDNEDEPRITTCLEALKVVIRHPMEVAKGAFHNQDEFPCGKVCCSIVIGAVAAGLAATVFYLQDNAYDPCGLAKEMGCSPQYSDGFTSRTACPDNPALPVCNAAQNTQINDKMHEGAHPFSSAQIAIVATVGFALPVLACLSGMAKNACRTIGRLRREDQIEPAGV